MATAVCAVAIVVDSAVVVDAGPIVREVATGAIRLILRRRPIDGLRVALVTAGASEIALMVERLVGQANVLVDMREPGVCHVADIAVLVGNEMPVIFAGRRIAIMAGRTGTKYLGMIDGCRRGPNRGLYRLRQCRCGN
jgi:hypothetical protein